jgi:hypothetical protein
MCLCLSTQVSGLLPDPRVADLVIAAITIAIAEELPLFSIKLDGYNGLDGLLSVVRVTRSAFHDR